MANSKYSYTESSERGTTILEQYPRDNSDDQMDETESRRGRDMAGGPTDLSMSISNGKVPRE